MESHRRKNLFRTCPQHLAEMNQATDRETGHASFIAGVNRFAETKQGRKFRPGEIPPFAGFPNAGADIFFQCGAERNPTVQGWHPIHSFINVRIIDVLQS